MQYAVKELMFLVEIYNLKFTEQTFESTPFGNWVTKTYSFYNDKNIYGYILNELKMKGC
mgnify:CR=1 FL=1